ncbi:hypothetical protein [Maricaulis maris]|uniref:Sel1 domain protein repeat-containing protein n=1 Tax=Maricaulis maris TaxID=74318 RepID=A0A495DMR1_9PROT|nr:hypothetical protein [Maricaulis maris]RKR03930.1 hypothetical protein C7435_0373 [Maricaulis maris]
MVRNRTILVWTVALGWGLGAALIGMSDAAAQSTRSADCQRYGQHRDTYLLGVSAGMEEQLEAMARQRQVPVQAAAFYWGGALMQAGDTRTLAQLTLATAGWPGQGARAERAMARISDEHQGDLAALLAGLMLSDGRGTDDPYRARAYLTDASRRGNTDATAFLGLYEACHSRRVALN